VHSGRSGHQLLREAWQQLIGLGVVSVGENLPKFARQRLKLKMDKVCRERAA
jgi:hypothetical protein